MPQTRTRRSYLEKVIVHYAHAGKQIWIWGWLRQRLTHSFLQMIASLMKFWGYAWPVLIVIIDDGILSSKYGIDRSPRYNNLNERKTKTISHNGKFLGDISCGRIYLPPVLEEVQETEANRVIEHHQKESSRVSGHRVWLRSPCR